MTDTTNTEPKLPDYPVKGRGWYMTELQAIQQYGDARAAHVVAQMQGEPVAVPSELRAIFDGLEFDAGAGRISAMALYTRMRDLCLAYAAPAPAEQPQAREITDAEIDALMGSAMWSPAARSNVYRVVRAAIALANGRG